MSILGLFDIGRTALFTTKRALDTTAHNIANASTPGYSRQSVLLQDIPAAVATTIGASGRGVEVVQIKRMYDSFINLQLKTEKSNLSYWDAYEKSTTKLENIFNESSANGIGPAITDFFNSWNEVSQNPADYAQRSLLLKKSEYLSTRINMAYTSIDSERAELLKGSQSLAAEVNTITASIASMNDKLASSPGSLDVLDQRDNAIERLNQLLKVTTFEDNNGAATILLNGTPLVDSSKSYKLSISADADNNMKFYVALSDGNRDVTSFVSGGELKANLDLRDTKIPGIKSNLNQFAFYLSETVNYYHKQGYGLDGSTGNDFFKSLFVSDDPVNGGMLSAIDVTDTTKLDYNKQYKIDYKIDDAANLDTANQDFNLLTNAEKISAGYQQEGTTNIWWRVLESTDGAAWTAIDPSSVTLTLSPGTASGVQYRSMAFNGLDIRIEGYQGALTKTTNVSETFTIKPNSEAARDIALVITDTKKIAASVDSFSVDTSNNKVVFNVGGADMTATLTPGLYSADDLAKALKTQMQTSVQTAYGISDTGTDMFSVTYDPNVKQFRITNNTSIKASQGVASQSTPVGATPFSFQVGSGALQTIDTTGMTLEGLRDAINATYSGVTANIYNDGTPTNPYRLMLTASNTAASSAISITDNAAAQALGFTDGAGGEPKMIEGAYRYTDNTSTETAVANAGNNYTGAGSKTFLVEIVTAGIAGAGVAAYKYSIDGGTTWLGSGGTAYDSAKAAGTPGGAITAVADYTNKWIDGSAVANTTNENVKVQFSAIGALSAGDKFSIDVFNPDMQPEILWTDSGSTAKELFGFNSDSSLSTGESDISDTEVSSQGLAGDNSNAIVIANLVTQMFISGRTPIDFYNAIVSDVGVDALASKQNLSFQFTIVAELESRRQQVSGVSLDEEAANLVMYQKSYEAAAKMISVADELMSTLLGMLAR